MRTVLSAYDKSTSVPSDAAYCTKTGKAYLGVFIPATVLGEHKSGDAWEKPVEDLFEARRRAVINARLTGLLYAQKVCFSTNASLTRMLYLQVTIFCSDKAVVDAVKRSTQVNALFNVLLYLSNNSSL